LQELENPLILIYDKKISDMNSLLRVLELAVKVIYVFFDVSKFLLAALSES
jgi:chaperonin GroEL